MTQFSESEKLLKRSAERSPIFIAFVLKQVLPFWLCATVQGAEKGHPFFKL